MGKEGSTEPNLKACQASPAGGELARADIWQQWDHPRQRKRGGNTLASPFSTLPSLPPVPPHWLYLTRSHWQGSWRTQFPAIQSEATEKQEQIWQQTGRWMMLPAIYHISWHLWHYYKTHPDSRDVNIWKKNCLRIDEYGIPMETWHTMLHRVPPFPDMLGFLCRLLSNLDSTEIHINPLEGAWTARCICAEVPNASSSPRAYCLSPPSTSWPAAPSRFIMPPWAKIKFIILFIFPQHVLQCISVFCTEMHAVPNDKSYYWGRGKRNMNSRKIKLRKKRACITHSHTSWTSAGGGAPTPCDQ